MFLANKRAAGGGDTMTRSTDQCSEAKNKHHVPSTCCIWCKCDSSDFSFSFVICYIHTKLCTGTEATPVNYFSPHRIFFFYLVNTYILRILSNIQSVLRLQLSYNGLLWVHGMFFLILPREDMKEVKCTNQWRNKSSQMDFIVIPLCSLYTLKRNVFSLGPWCNT